MTRDWDPMPVKVAEGFTGPAGQGLKDEPKQAAHEQKNIPPYVRHFFHKADIGFRSF